MTDKMIEDIICGVVVAVAILGTLVPVLYAIRKENRKRRRARDALGVRNEYS